MKICYTTHASNLTGASRSLLDMLSALRESDVEPIVLLCQFGPLINELKKSKIPYYIIPYCKDLKSPYYLKNRTKEMINFSTKPFIEKFIQKNHIDIVHNNSFLSGIGMEAAREVSVPYICHLRDLVQEDHGIDFLDEQKQISLLKDSNTALCISNYVYEKYSKFVDPNKIITVYDGININHYLDEEHVPFKYPFVNILMAGRIAPGKGQLEAVHAAQILIESGITDFKLNFVGEVTNHNYFDEIKNYIYKNKISQVEIHNFTNNLRKFRKMSDINLVCSRAEAMGRVTIESQLAGCLTIGSNVGATPELIQDKETGLLYEFGNEKDLADKIIYAINNTGKMKDIAKNGQIYARKKYDSKIYAKKILEIYHKIKTRKI